LLWIITKTKGISHGKTTVPYALYERIKL
jgi:hypothetical protein